MLQFLALVTNAVITATVHGSCEENVPKQHPNSHQADYLEHKCSTCPDGSVHCHSMHGVPPSHLLRSFSYDYVWVPSGQVMSAFQHPFSLSGVADAWSSLKVHWLNEENSRTFLNCEISLEHREHERTVLKALLVADLTFLDWVSSAAVL